MFGVWKERFKAYFTGFPFLAFAITFMKKFSCKYYSRKKKDGFSKAFLVSTMLLFFFSLWWLLGSTGSETHLEVCDIRYKLKWKGPLPSNSPTGWSRWAGRGAVGLRKRRGTAWPCLFFFFFLSKIFLLVCCFSLWMNSSCFCSYPCGVQFLLSKDTRSYSISGGAHWMLSS